MWNCYAKALKLYFEQEAIKDCALGILEAEVAVAGFAALFLLTARKADSSIVEEGVKSTPYFKMSHCHVLKVTVTA